MYISRYKTEVHFGDVTLVHLSLHSVSSLQVEEWFPDRWQKRLVFGKTTGLHTVSM